MDSQASNLTSTEDAVSLLRGIPTTVLIASSIPLLLLSLSFLIAPTLDPLEPPALWPRVPVIGHILGMIQHGFKYYALTTARLPAGAPIATLPILRGRVYVATGRGVVGQVARNSKTLSFHPFIGPFAAKITGAGPHAIAVMSKNLDGSEGDTSYYMDIVRRMRTKLAPGDNLTRLERRMYGFMAEKLVAAQDVQHADNVHELYDLARTLLNGGTFAAVYGDSHPYAHSAQFRRDVVTFEEGLDGLLLGFAPWLFARRTWRARERLVAAMERFYVDENGEAGVPADANDLAKLRYEEGLRYGLSAKEVARFEVSLIFGIIENSAPAAFWILLHVARSPDLVAELRRDLGATLKQATGPEHEHARDPLPFSFLAGLSTTVPLLGSVFDEVLRLQSFGCQFRQVMADTVLTAGKDGGEDGEDGHGHGRASYLLKKDAVVMVPNAVLHANGRVFRDPAVFDPRRFLAANNGSSGGGGKPADFRPFGGGTSLCPGRFFARAEMLALTAMVLLGFELECVDARSGKRRDWWVPRNYQHSQAAGIFPPRDKVYVRMVPRSGWNLNVDMER